MSTVRTILRRRQLATSQPVRALAISGLVALTIVPAALGVGAVGAAGLYLEVTERVPAVEDIEGFFDDTGLIAPVIVDRNGQPLLALAHPATRLRLWVGTDEAAAVRAPDHLVQAIVLLQDPAYWDHPGYLAGDWLAAIGADLFGRSRPPRYLTITEQLVATTLLPLDSADGGPIRRDFRLGLLAERLEQRYSKAEILSWFLNAIPYGHGIYGVEAASLALFGKHVDGLTLAESAVLAGLVGEPSSAWRSPVEIRQLQRETLTALAEAGVVSASQVALARQQSLELRNPAAQDPALSAPWAGRAVDELRRWLGEAAMDRGGLTLRTTLDLELQLEAECTARTQASRLKGSEPGVPEAGTACLAAGLLPPLRPGEAEADHAVAGATVVILDPVTGELLALVTVNQDRDEPGAQPDEALLYPFTYLTAFSRGFGPGSMVLDLPAAEADGQVETDPTEFHGPVLMRRALQRGYPAAADRVARLAGAENVERTLIELGLAGSAEAPGVSALDLGYAYGVLANDGLMVGRGDGRPEPTILLSVEDRFGRVYHEYQPSTRVVLSEALAYLMVDVLTDQAAGASLVGGSGQLGLDRAAGLVRSTSEQASWAVGFTPDRVLVVQMETDAEAAERPLTADIGPAPVLSALMRYASLDLAARDWQPPSGIASMEVCTPSGLLPTVYCPETVEELFLLGTEPTSFDNLFQPFRVNRETGNLATLATPLDLVEERVYLVPPPEAATWAEAAGLAQPPSEYDPLPANLGGDDQVQVSQPEPFDLLRGVVEVEGQARPAGFEYYRLQVGQGLNPSRWIQIGQDLDRQVWRGALGTWDTSGLNGLYTLQLVVVLGDGSLRTALVPVTIDNQAPLVTIRQPSTGSELSDGSGDLMFVEVDASDASGLEVVELLLDGRRVGASAEAPFVFELQLPAPGEHSLQARAVDRAGNQAESSEAIFIVLP